MESIQLRDAAGNLVDVLDGRLAARARTDLETALLAGKLFVWTGDTYNYDAIDTVLGVQNLSPDHDLCVERVICSGDAATEVIVHTSAGVVMAGTAIYGVNLNRESGLVAPAIAMRDETGNVQAAAVYNGRIVTGRFAANGLWEAQLGGSLIVPPGWMVGIDYTDDGAACYPQIIGYFKARA